jgi:agmatinase
LNVVDYGDIEVDPVNIENTFRTIQSSVSNILATNTKVLALGGDHSITLPLLRAHAEHHGPLAVIQFDAHCDTEEGNYKHGTPFRYAVKEGLVSESAFIQVGIRGPVGEEDRVEGTKALGIQVLPIDDVFEMGVDAVVSAIHECVGDRKVYFTLDIDVVDPAFAPGTGTPEIGGLTSYQIQKLVRGLVGLDLVGFDLVEVNPAYDHSDITSILAANLVFEFLSLLALTKRGAPGRK